MLSNLLRKIFDPAAESAGETDARTAVAALLVSAARADHAYLASEKDRITRVLAARYGLTLDDAEALRREAEDIEANSADTVRFTREIKDIVPLEERAGILTALWEVVLIDEERAPEEEALLRMVARLLGLTDIESAEARRVAQRS